MIYSAAMENANNIEILTILSRDARTSPEQISQTTGLPLEDVRSAIAQLEASGIIKRYKAIVDWEKADAEKVVAFIDVKVHPSREGGFDPVANRIAQFPEVKSVWLVSGHNDLRVLVHGQDLRDLGRFVAEKLATVDGVRDTETHFVTRRYKEDDDFYVVSAKDNK